MPPTAPFLLLLASVGCSASSVGAARLPVEVELQLESGVLATALEGFVSVDLDWWHNTTHDGEWDDASVLSLDLAHPTLREMARQLSGGFLRLGGSLDNLVNYLVGDDMTLEACVAPQPFVHDGVTMVRDLCLNMTRWRDINQFADDVGLTLVFGLSYHTDHLGRWESANPLAFLNHTAQQGYRLYGIELGEENAPDPSTRAFDALVEACVGIAFGRSRSFFF